MIKRRARGAGVPESTCCHTFRATGITAYLENGGTIENAQAIAAHESPRTTKLYDPTSDEVTLNEVERIAIFEVIKTCHPNGGFPYQRCSWYWQRFFIVRPSI
jgi:integrase